MFALKKLQFMTHIVFLSFFAKNITFKTFCCAVLLHI